MSGQEMRVWVDASSLATGEALEVNGDTVEDACCFRRNGDAQLINLAELKVMLKGINESVTSLHRFHMYSPLDQRKGASENEDSVWSRLETLQALIAEYGFTLDVRLTKFNQNKAEKLTRVSQRWLDLLKEDTESIPSACGAAM